MHIVTDYVTPDEPCHGLYEGPQGGRWVQKVFVVRGDAIAKYQVDLGPAEDFAQSLPQAIYSDGGDTVGEVQDSAERDRNSARLMQFIQQQRDESTLIEDSLAGLEQEHLAKRNRTVIGPHVFSQRGDYPGQFARRELRGRQKERTNGRN